LHRARFSAVRCISSQDTTRKLAVKKHVGEILV
jgi:hypothetical protein